MTSGSGAALTLTIADFIGHWRIVRVIDDHRAPKVGHFSGSAEIAPSPLGARYHETGTLNLGDAPPMRAERSYLWHRVGAEIFVQFVDGRDFHSFRPGGHGRRRGICAVRTPTAYATISRTGHAGRRGGP